MANFDHLSVGLFFGSDTGNTEAVTQDFVEAWTMTPITTISASVMKVEDYAKFDIIFIGLSTWYDGDLQSDFEDFFEDFKTIDFSGKIIAMYGLGDQYGYGRYFVDGLGILGEVILKNGGTIVGMWPTTGYDFEESKALYKENLFYGLALDDDNEVHETPARLAKWIKQVESELAMEIEKSLTTANTL